MQKHTSCCQKSLLNIVMSFNVDLKIEFNIVLKADYNK